jgi:hypothetical protein
MTPKTKTFSTYNWKLLRQLFEINEVTFILEFS